jgi:peptidoglycan/LPS O-acetylase OafA/YrhL
LQAQVDITGIIGDRHNEEVVSNNRTRADNPAGTGQYASAGAGDAGGVFCMSDRGAGAVALLERPVSHDGRLRYRAHLDGVRTLAVYLVVAFHAGIGVFSGGFIGVDVFFVLSGFLVTSILVRYLSYDGRMQWTTFYSRRVRRILPAAIVTLCITAIAYGVIASPTDILDALGGFRAACFYVANWYFIRQSTDYFAANVNSSPVLHFWSLAVEEQFYIVWPLVLGAVYVLARPTQRWRWWVIRAVVIAAGGASVVAALHLYSIDPPRAYYGTDTRAYQLLAGALVALTPQLLHLGRHMAASVSRTAAAVAVAVVLLLATSAVHVSPISRGVLVAICTCVMIVALDNANGGLAKRLLSNDRITYLGRISYGTYLWHWPVIILLTYNWSIAPVPLFLIDCVLATSLAAASFRIVEHPIRVTDALSRYRGPVIAIGVLTSILVGSLFMPAVLDSGNGKWRTARLDIPALPSCLHEPVEKCVVWHGGDQRILLVGDSTARMWIPALTEIAKRESLTFAVAVLGGCPWQYGLKYNVVQAPADCRTAQNDWYRRIIPRFNPDIIVLAGRVLDDGSQPDKQRYIGPHGERFQVGDANFEQMLINISDRSLARLRHPGRRLVIIEPTPVSPSTFDPLNCLSSGRPARDCTYQAPVHATPLVQAYRTAAKAPDVRTLDLDRIVCPRLPTCDPILHGIIVKRDATHLTGTFALSVWSSLDGMLHSAGLLTKP